MSTSSEKHALNELRQLNNKKGFEKSQSTNLKP